MREHTYESHLFVPHPFGSLPFPTLPLFTSLFLSFLPTLILPCPSLFHLPAILFSSAGTRRSEKEGGLRERVSFISLGAVLSRRGRSSAGFFMSLLARREILSVLHNYASNRATALSRPLSPHWQSGPLRSLGLEVLILHRLSPRISTFSLAAKPRLREKRTATERLDTLSSS